MSKDIIKVKDLRREIIVGGEKVKALRGVSFTIREGEFVTIMGTSGSGKSTLLNLLGCLDTPTSGEYELDGISVQKMSKNQRAITRNRKIGFVCSTTPPIRPRSDANAPSNVLRPLGLQADSTTRAIR